MITTPATYDTLEETNTNSKTYRKQTLLHKPINRFDNIITTYDSLEEADITISMSQKHKAESHIHSPLSTWDNHKNDDRFEHKFNSHPFVDVISNTTANTSIAHHQHCEISNLK